MRNLKLVDAVIALHEIASVVNQETEDTEMSRAIRLIAEKLHEYSIGEGRASNEADEIIKKAKE